MVITFLDFYSIKSHIKLNLLQTHWNHFAWIKDKGKCSCFGSYTWTQWPLYPLMCLRTSRQHSATYQRLDMWRKATWVVSLTLLVIIIGFRLLCGSSFLRARIIDAMGCISTTDWAKDNRWYFPRISCCQWNCGVVETEAHTETMWVLGLLISISC